MKPIFDNSPLLRKGFVNQAKLWEWLRSLEPQLKPETWNGEITKTGRLHCWFGVAVSLGMRSTKSVGLEISAGLRTRTDNLWGGGDWNSILVLKYPPGTKLDTHCDREIFDKRTIVINASRDDLFGSGTKFFYGGDIHNLQNGEVVEFDNSVAHGIRRVDCDRFSVSIRKVL